MSNTQQEIATPKACKQRNRTLIQGLIAFIFVSFLGLGLVALGTMLLSGSSAITILVLIVLSVVLAAIGIIVTKETRLAVKIILDVLTAEIAVILIAWFISDITPKNMQNNIIFIVTTAVMAILLICLDILKFFDKTADRRLSTRYITYAATFIALSVLCKMLGNAVSALVIMNMKLSFVYVPWVLSGIVLGPVGGVMTAIISDILGQLTIATGGAINPLTMLSNALFPLASALIFRFVKKGPDWLKLLVGMLISLIVCTMGIGALALYYLYNWNATMSFFTYTITMRWQQAIVIVVNYFLCLLLLPVVNKMQLRKRVQNTE